MELKFFADESSRLLRVVLVSRSALPEKICLVFIEHLPSMDASDEKKGMLEIMVGSNWVNGHAKSKSAAAQTFLWSRGVDLQRHVADWTVHIFREHNKEAGVDK